MPELVFRAVCLLIQSLVSVTQGGPIMQHVLLLQCHMPCKLMHGGFWGWNYRFSNAHTDGDKGAHTHMHMHTHTHNPHPSLLMQNASSPEPQTQFSTLLWASAVNSPARGGNRQHLSPATRWRNAPHTAVGVTVRSQARCRRLKSLLAWNLENSALNSRSHCCMRCLCLSRKASVGVPKQQNILMFRGSASCQWAQELRLAGDTEFLQDIITHWSPAQKMT